MGGRRICLRLKVGRGSDVKEGASEGHKTDEQRKEIMISPVQAKTGMRGKEASNPFFGKKTEEKRRSARGRISQKELLSKNW